MVIHFPFARAVWYTLADLHAFEERLLVARRADAQLSDALRLKRDTWMKLRSDELYPLVYLAQHLSLPVSVNFRIEPEGSEVDLTLRTNTRECSLQVTTAGPLWPGTQKDWGYDHNLQMQKLNQEGEISGWGLFRREPDGAISNREEVISTSERNAPYIDGLVAALKKKVPYRIPNCELVVYAVGYGQAMDEASFLSLAGLALQRIPLPNYEAVHILDEQFYFGTAGTPPRE
jgi:hypothetical protein